MLLLKHPEVGPAPKESEFDIPADTARAFSICRGQLLTIVNHKCGASAAVFAFTKTDVREFLSPHHTRVFSNSYVLTLGMRLVTNRRRPIMVLGKDTAKTHDLLLPASTTAYLASKGLVGRVGCVESVEAALSEVGIEPVKMPDPVSLFLNVEIKPNGSLMLGRSVSKPGDYVTCRVLIDCTCVVSSSATGLTGDEPKGTVRVRVHNEL